MMGFGGENLIIICMGDWYPLSPWNLTFTVYCVVYTFLLSFYCVLSKFIVISKIEKKKKKKKKDIKEKRFIVVWYKLFELQNL